jgi:hypothetical protein
VTAPEQAHDLVIQQGDCELHATCSCGMYLGYITVAHSLDLLGRAWEQHVIHPDRVLRTLGRDGAS